MTLPRELRYRTGPVKRKIPVTGFFMDFLNSIEVLLGPVGVGLFAFPTFYHFY